MSPHRRRSPKPNCHRAIELLARGPHGMTVAMLLAHGFTVDMMTDLVRAGLLTAKIERIVAGAQPMEVTRVRIMEAGRRSLAVPHASGLGRVSDL